MGDTILSHQAGGRNLCAGGRLRSSRNTFDFLLLGSNDVESQDQYQSHLCRTSEVVLLPSYIFSVCLGHVLTALVASLGTRNYYIGPQYGTFFPILEHFFPYWKLLVLARSSSPIWEILQ